MLNTAFIERFNGTIRERLANLTRKSRHAAARVQTIQAGMYLVGCTYNFCFAHHELSRSNIWVPLYSCNGGWTHRPYLERL